MLISTSTFYSLYTLEMYYNIKLRVVLGALLILVVKLWFVLKYLVLNKEVFLRRSVLFSKLVLILFDPSSLFIGEALFQIGMFMRGATIFHKTKVMISKIVLTKPQWTLLFIFVAGGLTFSHNLLLEYLKFKHLSGLIKTLPDSQELTPAMKKQLKDCLDKRDMDADEKSAKQAAEEFRKLEEKNSKKKTRYYACF